MLLKLLNQSLQKTKKHKMKLEVAQDLLEMFKVNKILN